MAPRTRATAQEETRRERRRRTDGSLDRMMQLKLAIPPQIEEENKDYALRWINDSGNRMHFMTQQDDWDVVDGVQPVPVGTGPDGQPIYARLCRKPRDFWEEDQKSKVADLREQEKGLLRGKAKEQQQSDLPDEVSYVPAGNSITTTGYSP